MRRIKVPLTLINLNDDGFHLLVEIAISGRKYQAVADTGASRSVFDRSFVEQLGIAAGKADEVSATTLFTTSETLQTEIPKLKIGRLKIRKYAAVALDLETVNQTYELMGHPRIVAILGSDIFQRYRAKINYKKLRLSFAAGPVKK